MPSAFQPELFGFEAANPSNSLYLSLLAGELEFSDTIGPLRFEGVIF